MNLPVRKLYIAMYFIAIICFFRKNRLYEVKHPVVVFGSAQSEGKAVSRLKRALPKSPRKKKSKLFFISN